MGCKAIKKASSRCVISKPVPESEPQVYANVVPKALLLLLCQVPGVGVSHNHFILLGITKVSPHLHALLLRHTVPELADSLSPSALLSIFELLDNYLGLFGSHDLKQE